MRWLPTVETGNARMMYSKNRKKRRPLRITPLCGYSTLHEVIITLAFFSAFAGKTFRGVPSGIMGQT